MPPLGSRYGEEDFTLAKILAVVIIFAFLFFVLIIVIQWLYLYQMNEAAEETSRMMAETGAGGGEISIIQDEMVPEMRLVFMVSLILFGLFDGIFAIMLWRGKKPKINETILLPLVIVYALTRFFSAIVMTMLPSRILLGTNSRALMNFLYLTIPIFSVVSLVIIIIVFKKVLTRKKATKILYGIPNEASF